jgi:hypothetical protein
MLRQPAVNNRFYALVLGLLAGFSASAQQPLALVQTIEMPEVPAGPYADHTSSTRFCAVTTISCSCWESAPAPAASAPTGHKKAAAGAMKIDFIVRTSYLPRASQPTKDSEPPESALIPKAPNVITAFST